MQGEVAEIGSDLCAPTIEDVDDENGAALLALLVVLLVLLVAIVLVLVLLAIVLELVYGDTIVDLAMYSRS